MSTAPWSSVESRWIRPDDRPSTPDEASGRACQVYLLEEIVSALLPKRTKIRMVIVVHTSDGAVVGSPFCKVTSLLLVDCVLDFFAVGGSLELHSGTGLSVGVVLI